jgi:hypothetical protein
MLSRGSWRIALMKTRLVGPVARQSRVFDNLTLLKTPRESTPEAIVKENRPARRWLRGQALPS